MITTKDAIETGRSLLGTPYSTYDCINFIKRIIRIAPGGDKKYTTAGTNTLWRSKDLIWKQETLDGAVPGMLAFKAKGTDVHHIGLVATPTTVLHSSSAMGKVVETDLYNGQWNYLARHRLIEVEEANMNEPLYRVKVTASSLNFRKGPSLTSTKIDRFPYGTELDVFGEIDGWLFIVYGLVSGYVKAEYTEKIVEEETHEKPAQTTTTLISADGQSFTLLGEWRIASD